MHRVTLLAALAGVVAPLHTADACGGFFCASEPMDQSKERIVFAVDKAAGEVEAHIQIFYQGTASEFAWIVPVASVPEVGLSTDELFQQLEWRTAPSFNLEWQQEGDCVWDTYYTDDLAEADGAQPPSAGGAGGGDVVTVVEKRQVGPYDQVTLQATSSAALLAWLEENQYDIPEAVGVYLEPYIADGSYFVALKLSNDSDAGDIAPIKMRYEASSAMIPLVLTAVAATPDMRLQPYVFADHRAVPDNYLHVKINEAAIDWLGWGSNYDDVITRAANEAGGQAFATDFSGSTQGLRGMLYAEGRFDLARLRSRAEPAEFVNEMLNQGFPRSASVQNLIREFIPMPRAAVDAGLDESSFYNCLDCYPEYTALVDFDAGAFADALDEVIVTPMREAEQLFSDFSTVTRMTSSMSPEEMTSDAYFVLNPDMGPVDNQHLAVLRVVCEDGQSVSEAQRTIVLQDGREILVPPEQWFWDQGVSYADFAAELGETNALIVEDTSASGEPVVIADNRDLVDAVLGDHNARVRDLLGLASADDAATTAGGCGGCDGAGGLGAGVWSLLALLGVRRRR